MTCSSTSEKRRLARLYLHDVRCGLALDASPQKITAALIDSGDIVPGSAIYWEALRHAEALRPTIRARQPQENCP